MNDLSSLIRHFYVLYLDQQTEDMILSLCQIGI